MVALRVLARLLILLLVVVGMSLAFAWAWDRSDDPLAPVVPPSGGSVLMPR